MTTRPELHLSRRERQIMDIIYAGGCKASDYTQHLLEIVRSLHSVRCPSLAAVAMARKGQFEGRLLAILDGRRNRRTFTRLGVVLAAAVLAAVTVPLAVLKATPPEKPPAAKAAKPTPNRASTQPAPLTFRLPPEYESSEEATRSRHDRYSAFFQPKDHTWSFLSQGTEYKPVRVKFVIMAFEEECRCVFGCFVSDVYDRAGFSYDSRSAKGFGYGRISGVQAARIDKLMASLPPEPPQVPTDRELLVGVPQGQDWKVRIYDKANLPVEVLDLSRLSGAGIGTRVVNVEPKSELDSSPGLGGTSGGLALSPDGRTLVAGGSNNVLKAWDAESFKPVDTFSGAPELGTVGLSFSPDGKYLAVAEWGKVVVLNAKSGATVTTLTLPKDVLLRGVSFTPDGRFLIAHRYEAFIYRVSDWQIVPQLPDAPPRALRCFQSRDGKWAVVSDADGKLLLWDMAAKKDKATLDTGHYPSLVAFSPDQTRVAVATTKPLDIDDVNPECHIRVWDVKTAKLVCELKPFDIGDFSPVESLLWSPDGNYVLAGARNGDFFTSRSVMVWNVSTGRHRGYFDGPPCKLTGMALTPDGKTLIAGSEDDKIRLWDFEAGMKRIQAFEATLPTLPHEPRRPVAIAIPAVVRSVDSPATTTAPTTSSGQATQPATRQAAAPATRAEQDLDAAARLMTDQIGGKWEVRTRTLRSGRHVRYVEGVFRMKNPQTNILKGRAVVRIFPFPPDARGRAVLTGVCAEQPLPYELYGYGTGCSVVTWPDQSAPEVLEVLELLKINPLADSAAITEKAIGRVSKCVVGLKDKYPVLECMTDARPRIAWDPNRTRYDIMWDFANNATKWGPGKDETPAAIDPSKPFCRIMLSLGCGPSVSLCSMAATSGFRIGSLVVGGHAWVWSSDPKLTEGIEAIVADELDEIDRSTGLSDRRWADSREPGIPPAKPRTVGELIVAQSTLIQVEMEGRLYEQGPGSPSFIRIRVANFSPMAIGVNLSDLDKLIYPSHWRYTPRPDGPRVYRNVPPLEPMTDADKARLIEDFKRDRLVRLEPGQRVDYYYELKGSTAPMPAGKDWNFVCLDGGLEVTDGIRAMRAKCMRDSSDQSLTDEYFPSDPERVPIPEGSLVFADGKASGKPVAEPPAAHWSKPVNGLRARIDAGRYLTKRLGLEVAVQFENVSAPGRALGVDFGELLTLDWKVLDANGKEVQPAGERKAEPAPAWQSISPGQEIGRIMGSSAANRDGRLEIGFRHWQLKPGRYSIHCTLWLRSDATGKTADVAAWKGVIELPPAELEVFGDLSDEKLLAAIKEARATYPPGNRLVMGELFKLVHPGMSVRQLKMVLPPKPLTLAGAGEFGVFWNGGQFILTYRLYETLCVEAYGLAAPPETTTANAGATQPAWQQVGEDRMILATWPNVAFKPQEKPSPTTQPSTQPVPLTRVGISLDPNSLEIRQYPADNVKPGLRAIGPYPRFRFWPFNALYASAVSGKIQAGSFELVGRLSDDSTPIKVMDFVRDGHEIKILVALSPKKPAGASYIWGGLPANLPPGRYHVELTAAEYEQKDGQLVPAPKTAIRAFYQLECHFTVGGTPQEKAASP